MRARLGRPGRLLALAALLAVCAGCSLPSLSSSNGAPVPSPRARQGQGEGTLPGEEGWRSGASSLIFGINQSFDWSASNLENSPAAQDLLKRTGFTLIRTFFSEHHQGWPFHPGTTTDADLNLRFQAIENVGARCLGVLYVSDDAQLDSSLAFLDHVLTYAETSKPGTVRCQLWEYGNEYGEMATYLKRWNHDIPYLRARHPTAKFIGPVLAGPYLDQMQTFLEGVKASGVLPDAISYHDYPCYKSPDYVDSGADAAACDAVINTRYASTIVNIRNMAQSILNRNLAVGITEWNVSPNFVNRVDGKLPLTMSATYQPRFVREIYAAMEAGGATFAASYDAMCGCGMGNAGALDLIDVTGVPRPWLSAYRSVISASR